MRVMVTGNLGYIGSVLVSVLMKQNYDVVGFDSGYFEDCVLGEWQAPPRQILKDIRHAGIDDFSGIDAVIHLAGLSNDPLGELAPGLTVAINRDATLRVARAAKAAGVKRFVYSSSQSMYGVSSTDAELDEDNSEKNPVTAYARTKWEAELLLNEMNEDGFCVTHFRPSTVFGASPRLRCDIVFNNLVACAYTTGKIEIKSDGTPWRPVVHVKDVCSSYIAGLKAPVEWIGGRAYNVGIENGNYTVRDLAEAAQKVVPGSELVFTGEHSDARTYRVSFQPQWDLQKGGEELVQFFKDTGFDEQVFRGEACTRLLKISNSLNSGRIDKELFVNASK
jgi:nucleoside-diphosphate-sugar epimerase